MDRKQLNKPELLAPAGDLERCKTAIRFGADAVYIGGQKFSLRSRASNFSLDEIREACSFAREYNAHIHVTVNEIPHNEDYEGLKEYLQELERAGVTAVIVASPSFMTIAKKYAPGLEVHCSTQMSITNSETARFLVEQLNLDRVVLARECTIENIREIVRECPVDTEAFIHGGMCVNISGRCTLSNRMTLRDANRGGCAQSCRWAYHLYDEETEVTQATPLFAMGSKDLCACNIIYDLMEAGVKSFKIEGRMKTAYYVASVVSAYRHLIDEIYENNGPLSDERMRYHRNEIMKAENRETCDGFYRGIADAESIIPVDHASFSNVNHNYLGTVLSYDPITSTAKMEARNPMDIGDMIEVMEPGRVNRTFRLETMMSEEGELLEKNRNPMRILLVKVPFAVKQYDLLRKV